MSSTITGIIRDSGLSTYSDIHSITVDAEGYGWSLTVHDPDGSRPRYELHTQKGAYWIRKHEVAPLVRDRILPGWVASKEATK